MTAQESDYITIKNMRLAELKKLDILIQYIQTHAVSQMPNEDVQFIEQKLPYLYSSTFSRPFAKESDFYVEYQRVLYDTLVRKLIKFLDKTFPDEEGLKWLSFDYCTILINPNFDTEYTYDEIVRTYNHMDQLHQTYQNTKPHQCKFFTAEYAFSLFDNCYPTWPFDQYGVPEFFHNKHMDQFYECNDHNTFVLYLQNFDESMFDDQPSSIQKIDNKIEVLLLDLNCIIEQIADRKCHKFYSEQINSDEFKKYLSKSKHHDAYKILKSLYETEHMAVPQIYHILTRYYKFINDIRNEQNDGNVVCDEKDFDLPVLDKEKIKLIIKNKLHEDYIRDQEMVSSWA